MTSGSGDSPRRVDADNPGEPLPLLRRPSESQRHAGMPYVSSPQPANQRFPCPSHEPMPLRPSEDPSVGAELEVLTLRSALVIVFTDVSA